MKWLAIIVAGVAAAQAQIPPPPILPQTNGPVQVYHDCRFGTLTVQPMICNGRPYGELFLSNSIGRYMKHDRAVTNDVGDVLGYAVDSYLPDAPKTHVTMLTWTNDFEMSTDLVHWTTYPVMFVRRANIQSRVFTMTNAASLTGTN